VIFLSERNGAGLISFASEAIKQEEIPMVSADNIREHMEVKAADGSHVGTVDHLEGQSRIKLTKNDAGKHHLIPLDWVDHVDSHVHLSKSASDVRQNWETLN